MTQPGGGVDWSPLKPLKPDPLFIIPNYSTSNEYNNLKRTLTHDCKDCGKPIPNSKDFETCFKCSKGGFKRR